MSMTQDTRQGRVEQGGWPPVLTDSPQGIFEPEKQGVVPCDGRTAL